MNPVDIFVIEAFAPFSNRWSGLDQFLVFTHNFKFLKSGIYATLLWVFWFSRRVDVRTVREHVVAAVCGGAFAMLVARVLAGALPYRARPLQNLAVSELFPDVISRTAFQASTSFPSDHAVYFFALATSVCFMSRRIGALALAHVALYVCLPRVYLGFHYATDVLVGAAIGISVAVVFHSRPLRRRYTESVLRFHDRNPSIFYACFFLLTHQMMQMFEGVRYLLGSTLG